MMGSRGASDRPNRWSATSNLVNRLYRLRIRIRSRIRSRQSLQTISIRRVEVYEVV